MEIHNHWESIHWALTYFVKSRKSLCHSINFQKKALQLGRAINHPTCKSVTEDYGIETYMAKAYELLDIETAICAGLYIS